MNYEITMARNLVDRLNEVATTVGNQPGNDPDPIRGLTQQAELTCDALLDARIQRNVREQYNGMAMSEDYRITFPDDSVVTALAKWCTDRIHLTTGVQEDDQWLIADHNPARVTMHPDGAPGCRIFDIIGALPATE